MSSGMIKSIDLKNIGRFDEEGECLSDLLPVNFLYGANGSGKTSISRVIENAAEYPECKIGWEGQNPLKTFVYNRDFVERHFGQRTPDGDMQKTVQGIYTFGDNNIEIQAKVEDLTRKLEGAGEKLLKNNNTLHGEEGEGGKIGDLKDLQEKFEKRLWEVKTKNYAGPIKEGFSGFNQSKDKFFEKYLKQTQNITSKPEVEERVVLEDRAESVFSKTLEQENRFSIPFSSEVFTRIETHTILATSIIGKEHVDIAALVEKLGNSDWVQEGRVHFNKLDDQCPFCQQPTDSTFRKNLEEFFDETYTRQIAEVDNLKGEYKSAMDAVLKQLDSQALYQSKFLLNKEGFRADLEGLRGALESNFQKIKEKHSKPSSEITLQDTKPFFHNVNAHIQAVNEEIDENNRVFKNQNNEKIVLKKAVWECFLNETKADYKEFQTQKNVLDNAISGLKKSMKEQEGVISNIKADIAECQKYITSIAPTIDEINKTLKSYGFTNFSLRESDAQRFYEIKRLCGQDAKETLSEGEKSFITFLYFLYLIEGGAHSSEGESGGRVVVFDDPVSSMDSDILHIVSQEIRRVIETVRKPKATDSIKQVFMLTHNIYFHKEVSFDTRRQSNGKSKDETFWIVRKDTEKSTLKWYDKNPIKSGYELLWQEVKQDNVNSMTVQNSMRRILEYYFQFLGGVGKDKIGDKFEGTGKQAYSTLMAWMHDGSHGGPDDLYINVTPEQIDLYKNVFERVFKETGHKAHYDMMMGKALPEVATPSK